MAEQLTPTQLLEVLRADRRQRWQQGDWILAESYFQLYPSRLYEAWRKPDKAAEWHAKRPFRH
jgi:hypothetical protein